MVGFMCDFWGTGLEHNFLYVLYKNVMQRTASYQSKKPKYILNFILASVRSKHCSKRLISPAAGICLPLVPGLCPVLHLRHFLPVADDHHHQLSPAPTEITWVWWCSYSPDSSTCSQQLIWTPCALTSLGLAPLVKQRGTEADANTWASSGRCCWWLLCSSLASEDLRGCVPLFTMYTCQSNGNLGSYMFVSGGVWPQTLEPLERLSGALCFQFFLCQHSLQIWYYWVNFLTHGNYRLKKCLCTCISSKSSKKRTLHSIESEIRCLPRKENLKWQLIFHFYGWHVEVSFQHLKNPLFWSHTGILSKKISYWH